MFTETALMLGQLFMVGFVGTKASDPSVEQLGDMLEQGSLGNVIFFQRNIENPQQLKELTTYLHTRARKNPLGLCPLFAVDQEGGRVQRLKTANGFPQFPSAQTVGTWEDAQKIRQTYGEMADMLSNHGFNMNLGPVIDLALENETGVIGRLERAYSADVDRVVDCARIFHEEHEARHLLTAVKHPPGHGSAKVDTHEGFVDVSGVWQDKELDPFRALLRSGHVDSVMMAHTYNRQFDAAYPASISKSTIEGMIRKREGYNGVVITDDLHMNALSRFGDTTALVKQAFCATEDILILSNMQDPTITEHPGTVTTDLKALYKNLEQDKDVMEAVKQSFERVKTWKTARLGSAASEAIEDCAD